MERWNWQRADWPRLRFDAGLLAEAEERFAAGAGALLARLRRVDQSDHERIAVERVAEEAMTTSAIEGEALDRASVQSSVRRALSLGVPDARATDAERGIAELLVDVCRTFVLPLDEPTLLRWHALGMRGRADLPDVGRWRTRREPMQVVSGRIDRPTVHFEAPPATRVPAEMARFIEWFNGGLAPAGRGALRPLPRRALLRCRVPESALARAQAQLHRRRIVRPTAAAAEDGGGGGGAGGTAAAAAALQRR
jgi:Fic family protein